MSETEVTENQLTTTRDIVLYVLSGRDAAARRAAARLLLADGEEIYGPEAADELGLSRSKAAKLLAEWQHLGLIEPRSLRKSGILRRTEARYYRASNQPVVARAGRVLREVFAVLDGLD